ncbi:MAG: T9SS type A sorting domain-containing protein, partial [Cytophagales bacterium]|nr:T9SS type A sorting domain-containing protein [Cytophagales bacterium]
SVTISSSATSVCSGTGVTFTATGLNGGSAPTYTWFRNNISQSTGTTFNYIPANGDVVRAVLNSGGTFPTCLASIPATSSGISLTVNPSLISAVSVSPSANPICAGVGVTYTANTINGGSAPVFRWLVNGNVQVGNSNQFTFSPNGSDIVRAIMTVAGSGTTCISNAVSTSAGVTVSVTGTISTSIAISSSTATVCSGTSVTVTSSATGTGTLPQYVWLRNGTVQSSNSGTFTFTPSNNDQIRLVMSPGGLGTSCIVGGSVTSAGITFTVRPIPAVPTTISSPSFCQNTTGTSLNTFVTGTGLTWYSSPTGNTTISPFPQTSNLGLQTYYVSSTNNGCESSRIQVDVNVVANVVPQVSISPFTNTICSGTGVSLTANGTNGGSTPSFTWLLNGISQSNGPSFSFSPSNSDKVRVIMTPGGTLPTCYISQSVTSSGANFIVNAPGSSSCPLPALGSISGPVFVPVGASGIVYSINSVAGVSYNWTVPNGVNIVSGQGTNQISVDFGPNPVNGTLGLTQTNSNGSNSVSLNIASGTPPSTTTIVGPLVVNPGQTGVVYSVTSVPGTNYNWTVPSGATIVSGQGTNQITVNFTNTVSGLVTLNSTNNFGTTPSSISVSTSPITYLIGNSADMLVQVLPNPFNESSFVKSTIEFKYSIFDLAGHEKENGVGYGGQSIGNALSPGAYVLKCEIGNTTQLIKLIKY